MGRRYREKHSLPTHPAKLHRGAMTIGCVCCGGGSQFTISAYRLLRKSWPEAWRKYIVEDRLGEIILAIKHDKPLDQIREVIERAGGLDTMARERPWIFDFTVKNPYQGYNK